MGNFQNIDINKIARNLLGDLEVTSNIFAATDHLDVQEEVLFNVVESMIIVYLRVRSFSCVRDVSIDKKKEKDAVLKEKALRKTLKKSEKVKNNEE